MGIQCLIDNGGAMGNDHDYLLKNAVNVLLNPRSLHNNETKELLLSFLKNRYLMSAAILIEAGVETVVDENEDNALHLLCQYGKSESIHSMKKILKRNPDCLNTKKIKKKTKNIDCGRDKYYQKEKQKR